MMIKFQNNSSAWGRLDFQIISRGSYKPYTDEAHLRKDIDWLQSEGYRIIEFDCSRWVSRETMYFYLYEKLDFLYYYAEGWSVLEESLNEAEIQDNGIVLVLNDYDLVDRKTAQTLMDVLVGSARRHMIFNEKLLMLIKVKDRTFKLDPLAPAKFYWY